MLVQMAKSAGFRFQRREVQVFEPRPGLEISQLADAGNTAILQCHTESSQLAKAAPAPCQALKMDNKKPANLCSHAGLEMFYDVVKQ